VWGIAVNVSLDEAVDRALLERMCEVSRHRGLDSRGTFFDEDVGFQVEATLEERL